MISQSDELSEMRRRIGRGIREERLRQNLSLVQMGHKAMVKPETLECLEVGRGRFDPHLILRIAVALDVSVITFFCAPD